MDKNSTYAIVCSVAILGFSLIYAALIEQGLVFQPAGSVQKGQIITTSTGHVNLGAVYAESKMVDVAVTIQTRTGDTLELLSLKGINPYDYELLIIEALKENISSGKSGYKVQYNMKGSIDNVTLSTEGTLIVKTYIKYESEHQSDYNFDIATRKYKIPVDEHIKTFTLKKVGRLVNNSQKFYKKICFWMVTIIIKKQRRNKLILGLTTRFRRYPARVGFHLYPSYFKLQTRWLRLVS